MNDKHNEYEELIKIIQALPQVKPSPDITQKIMKNLDRNETLSTWGMVNQTLIEARRITWSRFTGINKQTRNAAFYFLIAGLFFFFIGTVLFCSLFYMGQATKVTAFILLQSLLVMFSAGSLIIGGMMVASGMPGSERWARTSIRIYEILTIFCTLFIAVAVKTTLGVLVAVLFAAAGIVTAMTLMKALDNSKSEHTRSFAGDLHNA